MDNQDRVPDNNYLCAQVENQCYIIKAKTLIDGEYCQICQHYGGPNQCHAENFEDCMPVKHNLNALEAYIFGILRR
jgi:hypothetical protein